MRGQPTSGGNLLQVQGFLAQKKQRPSRTLQKDYAQGPMVVLVGGAVSYERGTPVLGYFIPVQGYRFLVGEISLYFWWQPPSSTGAPRP